MREDRNQFQIIRKDARNCFVESLNDSFSIGRIHLAFAAYDQSKPAGQRQTNNVHIYIAVDEFLELCRKLDCGELRYMLQSKKKNGDNTPLYQCLGGTSAENSEPSVGQGRTEKPFPRGAVGTGQQSGFPVCCRQRPRRNQRKGIDCSEIR